MKRIKQFTSRHLILLCLLACFIPATLRLAHAQTDRQTHENIPGIPAGYTIIEGDIVAPISLVNALRKQSVNSPQATFKASLWPNGIVPFEFENTCAATSTCTNALQSGCVSAARQTLMLNAMAVLAAAANVDFRQCAGNKCSGNYIHLRDSTNDTTIGMSNTCQAASGNNSLVGLQGGQQIINIVSWTGPSSRFIIVHELLHALGVIHEQSRPDSGTFVDITSLCKNVQGGCMGGTYLANFPIDSTAITYGGYDFDSVMHYGQCSFSSNTNCPAVSAAFPDGGITIQIKAPYNTQTSPTGVPWPTAIGQRVRLSVLDGLTLSFLYAQPNWRFVDPNYTGSRGPADGTFLRAYQSFDIGVSATPVGGTLWLQPGTYFLAGGLTKNITLRAPLDNVTLRPRMGVAGGPIVASVSAASYNGELAADSIAAAFGENLAAGIAIATSLPLPTQLGGVTVKVKDAAGTERDAPLFFVSPNQINYQIPTGVSVGIADVTVFSGGAIVARGAVPITPAAPAFFSANASGEGVPAAALLRVRGDAQFFEPVARFDQTLNSFVPLPFDLGPEGDQVFLILFGTGFRSADAASPVTVTIGGEEAEVLYAGPAPGFVGLDQANMRVPRSLIGRGEVSILLTADNRSANAVTVSLK